MIQKDPKQRIFSEDTIQSLAELGLVLRKIRDRVKAEEKAKNTSNNGNKIINKNSSNN